MPNSCVLIECLGATPRFFMNSDARLLSRAILHFIVLPWNNLEGTQQPCVSLRQTIPASASETEYTTWRTVPLSCSTACWALSWSENNTKATPLLRLVTRSRTIVTLCSLTKAPATQNKRYLAIFPKGSKTLATSLLVISNSKLET